MTRPDRRNNPDYKEGTITEWLPNMQYWVKGEDELLYRCYVAGRLKQNKIKLAIGDKVVFYYPRGSSVGRIELRRRLDGEK